MAKHIFTFDPITTPFTGSCHDIYYPCHDQRFIVPNNCSVFYWCDNTVIWLQSCPLGTGFSESEAECAHHSECTCPPSTAMSTGSHMDSIAQAGGDNARVIADNSPLYEAPSEDMSGLVAGCIVAVIAVLIICVLIFVIFWRKYSQRDKTQAQGREEDGATYISISPQSRIQQQGFDNPDDNCPTYRPVAESQFHPPGGAFVMTSLDRAPPYSESSVKENPYDNNVWF